MDLLTIAVFSLSPSLIFKQVESHKRCTCPPDTASMFSLVELGYYKTSFPNDLIRSNGQAFFGKGSWVAPILVTQQSFGNTPFFLKILLANHFEYGLR